jgi:hypothetical protein
MKRAEAGIEKNLDDDLTPSPSWVRVSSDTSRESGIPPAGERWSTERTLAARSDEHAELAMAESVRTEANLGLLVRSLQHLVIGAEAARNSNASLSRELDTLRELLARSHAEEMAWKHRVVSLEIALDATKRDAALSRAFFIDQEDAFLRELLTDHEREVRELRHQLADAIARRDAIAAPVARESATEIGAVRLRTLKLPLPSHSAEATPVPVVPPRPASRPPLRPKQDASTRPLVGYSLGKDDVAEERVEGLDVLSVRGPTSST